MSSPLPALDRGDLLVVAVEDHALAAAVARVGVPLPPGEYGLALQLLDAEVGDEGVLRDRERVEPHEVALRIEDHRTVLHGAELGSDEDVSFACRCVVLGYRDGRGLQIRP